MVSGNMQFSHYNVTSVTSETCAFRLTLTNTARFLRFPPVVKAIHFNRIVPLYISSQETKR
jgi:hypothetical protein